MAYVAIVSTLIFGSLFVGVSGFFQTSEDIGGFESAVEDDLRGETDAIADSKDSDEDGLSDRLEETQYGTDPLDKDTDNDGMEDGWEVQHGLNPLDNGDSEDLEVDPTQSDETEDASIENESDSWPDPNQGPNGDPDQDGLTNQAEQDLGTDPQRADTDNDGLNDRWESQYTMVVQSPAGEVTLFNPLDGNWDCVLLDQAMQDVLESRFNGENGLPEWDSLASNGRHSCDMVLDSDDDGLANFEEESYGTNPTERDSDMDLIDDIIEVENATILMFTDLGENCNAGLEVANEHVGPFFGKERSWFLLDMDGDGLLNGPSDWDTDGDGMPDGFEFCYSDQLMGAPNPAYVMDPANASDGYHDWDEDGMNNVEEYEVAQIFGPTNFTSPWRLDTDLDDMPDGWEATNGLNPRDGNNRDDDPDRDGWDVDQDGNVVFATLENTAVVHSIDVELNERVLANQTVIRARITLGGGNQQIISLDAPVDGYVYSINVEVGQSIDSRIFAWASIVEEEERFTNVMEYMANDRDGDGIIDGRSTDPLNSDTDADGLIDGIEVMGWEILVVNRGVQPTWVTSDPGLYDTDADGLSDFAEFSSVCNGGGSNASNPDTDSDGLSDLQEAGDNFMWDGEYYSTSPCMFDTDNDGLEDGEEVIAGEDNFLTHANNSDTDNDGLIDGHEVLFVPRPFQNPTNPLFNDTDSDGMLDGWEMQVKSAEENTNSHSLWVATSPWERPGCDASQSNSCTMQPGGYVWQNWLGGFALEPKFKVNEMNITGFLMPGNSLCNGCNGRWALDP